MKNYKEKYENALEIARKINNGDGVPAPPDYTICEVIFPELKESEDEKIRKNLIKYFRDGDALEYKEDDIIAWLEKQDPKKHEEELENAYKCTDEAQYRKGYEDAKHEFKKQCGQKSTDKIEPKFKNGQWIVWQDKYYKVYDNGCGYELVDQNGLSKSLGYENINKNTHLWNIAKDAKDGDVLATKDAAFIFKHMDKTGLSLCKSYCEVIGNSELGLGFDFSINGVHPATKEQRDLLFQKMKEAGYDWDAEKKELKKIDARENLVLDGDLMQADCMMIEQKPVWSEEDERNLKKAIECCTNRDFVFQTVEEQLSFLDWLESLKERYNWKPSDEQMAILWDTIGNLKHDNYKFVSVIYELYNDLKKLREE